MDIRTRNKRIKFLNMVANYYHSKVSHPLAQKYLAKRKISPEMVNKFNIGFALGSYTDMGILTALDNIAHAEHLGLVMTSTKPEQAGRKYPYFRNRIIFPLNEVGGNTLGFMGRDILSRSKIKYLNSKESDIFQKNLILYGHQQSYKRIRQNRYVILVEGNIDTIRTYERGYPVLGLSSCNLSEGQIIIIGATYPNVFLMMDGDKAGREGAIRITTTYRDMNKTTRKVRLPRLIELPDGYDPDKFFLKYPEPEDYINEKMTTDTLAEFGRNKRTYLPLTRKLRNYNFDTASVKNSHNILDVIGRRVQIMRAGSNYICKCPFHDERTPSFVISESKQIFRCFGCGISGDVYDFLMKFHEIGFRDALAMLSQEE